MQHKSFFLYRFAVQHCGLLLTSTPLVYLSSAIVRKDAGLRKHVCLRLLFQEAGACGTKALPSFGKQWMWFFATTEQ